MTDSEVVVGTGLRISLSRNELASRLAIVARGVSTRTAVLVLGGIQLRAEAGRLNLAATDMELSLRASVDARSEEHTSELQSRRDLVCRLLLEKKKNKEKKEEQPSTKQRESMS